MGSHFLSFVSVMFPPHIRRYTHAHMLLDEYPQVDSESINRIKGLVLLFRAWFLRIRRRQGASLDYPQGLGFKSLRLCLPRAYRTKNDT